MNNDYSETPKRNWPLIWGGIAVGLLVAACAVGCLLMWVYNFNILNWME